MEGIHYLDRTLVSEFVQHLQKFYSQTEEHERPNVKLFFQRHTWELFCFSTPLDVCHKRVRGFCCCTLTEPLPVKRLEAMIDVFLEYGKRAQVHRERISLTKYISQNAKTML
jgi:hypothetical protein